MAMKIENHRTVITVILAALLMGGLSSAAWTFQEPKRPATSEEARKLALERLTKELQATQLGARPIPAPAAQQKASPPQPAPQTAPPSPPPAPAPGTPTAPPVATGEVQLNYENEDLTNFINQIASTIGLSPLIIDPEIKGTVNLNSGRMSKSDILPLFSLILKNNNAAVIHSGGAYQIVPISSALKKGVEIIDQPLSSLSEIPQPPAEKGKKPEAGSSNASKQPPSSSAPGRAGEPSSRTSTGSQTAQQGPSDKVPRLATFVIRTEFIPVKDLIEPIRLFMTEGGVIMPYERLNMLILTDYSDSVARIMQLIRMLDTSYLDPDLVELVKIEHNASADVVDDLKKLFGNGSKDSATGVSFISLDRLNAIFVMASSRRALEEAKGWIKELDSSSAKNIQTYVYVVENSTASNIAMMLSALYGGEGTSGSTAYSETAGTNAAGGPLGTSRSAQAGTATGLNTPATSATPFSQTNNPNNQMGGYGNYGMYGGGIFGQGRQLGPQLNAQRTITSQVLRGGQFSGLQDTVRLVVDDVNNSLIIQATPVDYAYILETIKKMDVLPRQALIDAKIYEVDLTDSLSFGISASLQPKGTDTLTTGELNGSGQLSATTFIPVGNARQIMAALETLRLKTKVRVLESPSVLALDGQQAQIMVGAELPYPSTSFIGAVGGSTTSVQYRDTGISLLVIPRISASGHVTLDLVQEVSAPGASVPIGDGSAPSFTKTSVSTTLSVKDGETVAIAGLIRDGNDFSRSGIPFLSQIPLLGNLFGQTSKNSHRNELIVLITPHVIRTPEKLHEMTQELRDSLRNVRKYADEKEKETKEDKEDAREDRLKQEQKDVKKSKAPKTEGDVVIPTSDPKAKKNE
jgi:general secretion pathway protein D